MGIKIDDVQSSYNVLRRYMLCVCKETIEKGLYSCIICDQFSHGFDLDYFGLLGHLD